MMRTLLTIASIWFGISLAFATALTIWPPRRKRTPIMFNPNDVPLQFRRRSY